MVTISIIDDDSYIVEIFTLTFERAGYSVLSYTDPLHALRDLPGHNPCLIILDLMMTPITGLQFLDRWKTLDPPRSVPVVILSAWDVSPADREKYAREITRIIRKPVLPKALLGIVRELCPAGQDTESPL
ncbi:MAG: transcriptional regulator PhoB [Methanoregulaceae archaeon PtaU1.Bin059]|nr:MAG: transcriptional regulator PhoB [Methanoregulaceae archaeon PtaB.Bin152]OPY38630.1 MAG: transcriptional regulator PhoB [Methanoregulaceae archaeon PtaU1.Bin059]